ncbi:MAG: single-stranded DNA-binding protein [Flavobacteriales bacterium]
MSAEITVIGNLTADPEIRYFDSGTAKAEFSVAVNRVWNDANGEKKEQTSYYKVEAWKYLAEDAVRVLSKGVRVVIKGTLEQKTWDDKETGDKRSTVVITANAIGLGLISIESFERRRGSANHGEVSVASTGAKTTTRPANNARPKLPARTQTLEQEDPF